MIRASDIRVYLNGKVLSNLHHLELKARSDGVYLTAEVVMLIEVKGKWVPGEPVLCFVQKISTTRCGYVFFLSEVATEVTEESKKVKYVDFERRS